jgi:hypothetical protein
LTDGPNHQQEKERKVPWLGFASTLMCATPLILMSRLIGPNTRRRRGDPSDDRRRSACNDVVQGSSGPVAARPMPSKRIISIRRTRTVNTSRSRVSIESHTPSRHTRVVTRRNGQIFTHTPTARRSEKRPGLGSCLTDATHEAAPGASLLLSRYAVARAFATTIIAAL